MYPLGLLSLYIRMEEYISTKNDGLPLVLVRLDIDAAVLWTLAPVWGLKVTTATTTEGGGGRRRTRRTRATQYELNRIYFTL